MVVLSMVRDGRRGMGFWNDPRRLTVALTRARRRLVLFVSWSAEAERLGGRFAQLVADRRDPSPLIVVDVGWVVGVRVAYANRVLSNI